MATKRKSNGNSQEDRPPIQADVAPFSYPQNEYKFEIQALFEIQKTLGEVKTSIDSLKSSLDSTKRKVDDLVTWKNRIIGGAVVLGAVVSAFVFVIGKSWDYISIRMPPQETQQPPGGNTAPRK